MSTRDRTACVAALGLALTGAAILAARTSDVPAGRILPADSLRWEAISVEGQRLHPARRPRALLYIQPGCVHCEPAAVLFTAEARRLRVDALIVSGSGESEAARFARGLPVGEIALDSSGAFRRGAGIRWVPAIVIAPEGGPARVSLLDSPDLLRDHLAALGRGR